MTDPQDTNPPLFPASAAEGLLPEQELLRILLRTVGDGVILTDEEGRVAHMNPPAEALTGFPLEKGREMLLCRVFRTTGASAGLIPGAGTVHHTLLINAEGMEIPVEYCLVPFAGGEGREAAQALIFRRSDKQLRLNQAEYMGYHDKLTGLYNRRFLEEEMSRLDTLRNLPLALIMGDVNGLKLMNDVFGHEAGDLLLKAVADSLKQACRNDEIISRQGGDEFVILLPGVDEKNARGIVARIKKILQTKHVRKLEVSVSFGIGVKTSPEENLRDALTAAEDAMYREKLFSAGQAKERALARILELYQGKNEMEGVRVERLYQICGILADAVNFRGKKREFLQQAAFLHDIGKVAIDSAAFIKDGKLGSQDWQNVQRHPEIGYRILSAISGLAGMAEYVLYHHEKWDGSGYPKGLRGSEIPLEARILAIVDSFEAMTSKRPYREALPEEEALRELERHAGTQFDPELVRIFVERWPRGL